jgi:hypothetical protein
MAKKKMFFDLEFTGLHKLTTAISIGLICEDGKKYYAEFTDFDKYQIDDFLRKEVLSKRILGEWTEADYEPTSDLVLVKGDIDDVYSTMLEWLEQYKEDGIEMWGDLLAYDWVLFISLFGNGLNLPKFIDYIPMDLCTALKLYGEDKDVNRDIFAYGEEIAESNKTRKHNSLYDAETSFEVFKKLLDKAKKRTEEEEEEVEQEDTTVEEYEEEAKEVIAKEEQQEEIDMSQEKNDAPIKTVVKKETTRKAGRPNKKQAAEKKKVVKPIELSEVTSNINPPDSSFIEPSLDDVNSTEQWETPL